MVGIYKITKKKMANAILDNQMIVNVVLKSIRQKENLVEFLSMLP